MSRENAPGAVNQQERLDAYLAGFVDGEGSFHVAIARNRFTRLGWQLVPEFRVSQDVSRRQVLDLLLRRFDCGAIRENHRNSSDATLVYVVRRRIDLLTKVIPFFERQPLLSAKQMEVLRFAHIVRRMVEGDHLNASGYEILRREALLMNGEGRYRRLHKVEHPESSETICQTPPMQEVKIWSDLYGDMQSQTEMIWPPTESGGE